MRAVRGFVCFLCNVSLFPQLFIASRLHAMKCCIHALQACATRSVTVTECGCFRPHAPCH